MTTKSRDRVTDAGILVVGLAAAILTFTTLAALAFRVGFHAELWGFQTAWLLPITIDAAGVVAARVWLRGAGPSSAVRYAQALALACIGMSIGANAAEHILTVASIVVPPWWVVLPVTSVPPAVLAAVVHLGYLLSAAPVSAVPQTPEDAATPREQDSQAFPELPALPVRTVSEAWDHYAGPPVSDHPDRSDHPVPDRGLSLVRTTQTAGPDRPDHPGLDRQTTRSETAGPDRPDRPVTSTDHPGPAVPDHLLDEAVRWFETTDGKPSISTVRSRFGVGYAKAVQLLDHYPDHRQTTGSEGT